MLSARGISDPAHLATDWFSARRALNGAQDVVPVPPENADQATVDAFYKRLGRPDKADAYTFTYPDGARVDPAFETFGKSLAHKLGLNPKQAQSLVSEYMTYAATQQQAMAQTATQQNEAAVAALRQRMGPDYDAAIAGGQAALQTLQANGLPQGTLQAIMGAVGVAPVLELFAALGKATREGGKFVGGTGGGAMSAEQARAEITRLQSDPAFTTVYRDGRAMGHKDAVARMERLHQIGYPAS